MGNTRGVSKIFTEQEVKQLEVNPNVQNVTDRSITYVPAFKLTAVKAYQDGQTPIGDISQSGV
jgi:transposase